VRKAPEQFFCFYWDSLQFDVSAKYLYLFKQWGWPKHVHLFVAIKENINVSKKYSLTVTCWYQIVRSTSTSNFHRMKFYVDMPHFPRGGYSRG